MKKRQADCTFQCPARGRIDFSVWPRKNETSKDACLRKLSNFVDAPQLPHCEPLRIRYIDGIGPIKIGKAGTRLRPIRIKDLGRLPAGRIVRED